MLVTLAATACGALAQPASGTPPAPGDPAWGAYRSGLGYPVGSEALLERAAYEGIDPRCLMTVTVAWTENPRIVANVAAGLMVPIVEFVPRVEAQAALLAESPFFNADIDCVGSWAGWGGGVFDTNFGPVDFGDGRGGRGTYGSSGDSTIVYTLSGHTLTGRWVQPVAARRCSGEAAGSEYWGKVRFEFNEDFSAFQGAWDYCGDGDEAHWNGSRVE